MREILYEDKVLQVGPGAPTVSLAGDLSAFSVSGALFSIDGLNGKTLVGLTGVFALNGPRSSTDLQGTIFSISSYRNGALVDLIEYSSGASASGLQSFQRYQLGGDDYFETRATSAHDDVVMTGQGNDRALLRAGNDMFDGGDGRDTAIFARQRGDFTVSVEGQTTIVTDKSGAEGRDTLTAVERLQFSDGTLAFDVNGIAGQAYRIYQAAFARTPDAAGLGYWTRELESTGNLTNVARSFLLSAEFAQTYGNPATLPDRDFVFLLYQNVLGRGPDSAGEAYWLGELGNGMRRESALASFSESVENQQNVTAAVKDGIWFI